MDKIVLLLIFVIFFYGCGKKGDIPLSNQQDNDQPAKIDKERIYKF